MSQLLRQRIPIQHFIPPPNSIAVYPADPRGRGVARKWNGNYVDTTGSTTQGIQEAIDALPAAGGTVFLSPGAFSIGAALFSTKTSCEVTGCGIMTSIEQAAGYAGGLYDRTATTGTNFAFTFMDLTDFGYSHVSVLHVKGANSLRVMSDTGDGGGARQRFIIENNPGSEQCDMDFRNVTLQIGNIDSSITPNGSQIRFSRPTGDNANPISIMRKGSSSTVLAMWNAGGTIVLRTVGVTTNAFNISADGEAQPRFNIGSDTVIAWGPGGSTAVDTNLYRNAADHLKSDDKLSIEGTAAEIRSGSGTPEGVVTAPIGSIFLRTDGGASTTLYVKESGTGNTGWVAK